MTDNPALPAAQEQPSHWKLLARQWGRVTPPLRPCAQDIAELERVLYPVLSNGTPPSRCLLILGVTPEFARMRVPADTRIRALDANRGMIQAVWPGKTVPHSAAIRGNWLTMPLRDGVCSAVVGDGCFSSLAYPDGYRAALASIRRVLQPAGVLAIRFFMRPSTPETVDRVLADMWAGAIGNFSIMKWRLAMALHGRIERGTCLGDLWTTWCDRIADNEAVARATGWDVADIETMRAYENVPVQYTFPTLDEARVVFNEHFVEVSCRYPTYEMGDRCPTIFYRIPSKS